MFHWRSKTKTLNFWNPSLDYWIVNNVFSGQEKSDLMELSINKAKYKT